MQSTRVLTTGPGFAIWKYANMTLADFTEPALLVTELLHERQESAIAELSIRLAHAGRVNNARAYTRAVLDHEALVSTVFDGIGFSLARGRTARELSFAIGLSEFGVRWGNRQAPPVFAVVLFAIPDSAERTYMSLIMTFAKLLKDEAFLSALCQSKQPEEMFDLLAQASFGNPAHD